MKSHAQYLIGVLLILTLAAAGWAEVKIVADHNPSEMAASSFSFKNVPVPCQGDAATNARFSLVDGVRDANGGSLDVLHDGRAAGDEDQPAANFFFNANTEGGRLLVDLGKAIRIQQVNTYSWHPNTRGPQVYDLYASDGSSGDFNSQPAKGTDPATCGWKRLAAVDTRPQGGEGGGQYAVSISDTDGVLGTYRYLLFDVSRTEAADPFGNTFYSEIDVIDPDAPPVKSLEAGQGSRETFEADDGTYQIVIDTTDTPDLTEWAQKELAPVLQQWYPRIVKMLPSEGYQAPRMVNITFSATMQGVAATGGTRVRCAEGWFRQNLKGEAKGAVVHELVHVVQQYGLARRNNPNATRTPGWLVEGIADYIRWFLYEPETHGADITERNISRARYDGSYRVSGNFLDWVTETHDQELVRKLNAAAREGTYNEGLWKEYTGLTVQELAGQWKESLEKEIAAAAAAAAYRNKLTDQEKQDDWKLLFDGESLNGWHTFKMDKVRPGWQVKDGALTCVDPHDAGDLCTDDQYEWFELQLEYNISQGGNSGIMYHVTDQGGAAWATGPEFQLEDNAEAKDPIRCGWLYALYQPPINPKTGRILDATRPAGQWNHVRLLITPERCEHAINGVKYFDYVLGSEDFKDRVNKSKFSRMPLFAKPNRGYIALQGDHGQISFRSIKIRPIQPKN
ncbi:MAG: DUF1080 domain-containing protein [Sedimentisphaerales bacterium]|nr:DUF1080 domain-containing protein [Sedimentisphaerales bacterium]